MPCHISLQELPKLRYLAINYRSFSSIVDTYMERLLRKGQIQSEHLPPVVFEMPALSVLDLEETKINCLPRTCVSKLRELYLAKNFLQKMPSVTMTLDQLEILDVSHNMIETIPAGIERLTQLRVFNLTGNNIIDFPIALGKLNQLTELMMGHNKLSQLPAQISQLRQLKRFILDENELSMLPTSIVELEELETLDLTANKLEELPRNFYEMKSLTTAHTYHKYYKSGLWLHKNPLTVPPPSVWTTSDPERIYYYLRKLEIRQTPDLQRQKLMVLGASQSGKTSLTRALYVGKSVLMRPLEDSTELLELRAWRTVNLVSYLMYDFGGNPVYRPTLPLFLDAKAFFLIVYDHHAYALEENYEHAIGDWLEILLMHTPGAVVKIIGTHIDLCPDEGIEGAGEDDSVVSELLARVQAQLNEHAEKLIEELVDISKQLNGTELEAYEREQLKNQKRRLEYLQANPLRLIDDVALVSNVDGTRGLADLKEDLEIISVDKTLFAHAQRSVPSVWFKFNDAIKMHESFSLSWKDACAIARQLGITSESLVDCLHFLRDIGQVLWYDKIAHLSSTVFHKPMQLIHVLRCVFRHDTTAFFDFATNRALKCKGGFTEDVYLEAERNFRTTGEISRALLLSLWFYLKLSYTAFDDLVQLTPKLDLWYAVPQPVQPLPYSQFQALLVVPTFNRELHDATDLARRWPESLPTNQRELSLQLWFPLGFPHGVYERYVCRLQALVYFRIDWRDLVYAELESCKLLVSQDLNPEENGALLVQLRSVELRRLKEVWLALARELRNVLKTTPGLVWYTKLYAEGCEPFELTECFPQEVQVM